MPPVDPPKSLIDELYQILGGASKKPKVTPPKPQAPPPAAVAPAPKPAAPSPAPVAPQPAPAAPAAPSPDLQALMQQVNDLNAKNIQLDLANKHSVKKLGETATKLKDLQGQKTAMQTTIDTLTKQAKKILPQQHHAPPAPLPAQAPHQPIPDPITDYKHAYPKPGPGKMTIQGMPADEPTNPGLSMASKDVEKRRMQQGFTTEAFRGGEHTKNTRVYLTASEKLAKMYNKKVKQYWLNTKDYYMFNAHGKSWGTVEYKAKELAQKAGAKGIIIHNVGDEPNLTSQTLGPQTTYLVFDLSTVRAPTAAFDPAKSNIKDLLASGAAIAVGGASAAALSGGESKAAPLPKVWHISPNDFEKFGPLGERFGTGEVPVSQPGEGAAKKGVPGYYFAENTGTRDYYQRVIEQAYGKAYQYENSIKASSEELVDLDRPMNEQPARVQEVLKAHGINNPGDLNSASLEQVQVLDRAGVKGVQYFDKYSRPYGTGSRNFVVFSPDTVELLKKTGLGALLAAGGASFAGGRAQAQPANIDELMRSIQPQGAANGPTAPKNMQELMQSIKPHDDVMTIRDVPPTYFQRFLKDMGTVAKGIAEPIQERNVKPGTVLNPLKPGAGNPQRALEEFYTAIGRPFAQRETEKIEGVMRPEVRNDPQIQEINKAAETQDAQDTGSALAALLPGGGLVPYGKMAKSLYKSAGNLFSKPVSPLQRFTDKIADDLHQLRQTTVADKAEIFNYLKTAPPEARTAQVQEIIYHLIEDKDWTKLDTDHKAFMQTPEGFKAVKTAAQHLAPLRQESSNIFVALRKIPNIAADELVDPTYIHRRGVGHTPAIDPSTQHANPIVGYQGQQKGLPTDTTALQNRKFMGGQSRDGSRVVISEGPAGWEVHEKGQNPVQTKPIDEDHFEYQGKTYTVGQATTKEIERETPASFYKNALANTADSLVRLRAVARHVEWLGQLTKTAEWQMFASQNAKFAKSRGWKEAPIPTLQKWFMEPKLAEAFEDFVKPGIQTRGPDALLGGLRKFNQMATASIFFTPTPHIENVMGHWLVGRGWDWLKPSGARSLLFDGAKAIRAVSTQNKDYQRLLKAGNGLIYGGVRHAEFFQNIARVAGMEIKREAAKWDPIARTLGLGPSDLIRGVYEGSKRMLWWANDVLMMQRVLELERRGMSLKEAVTEAEKHIPNYRIPSRVFGSRMFSQLLQEPAFTVFSRYHYGAFRSYAMMVRDMLGPNATRAQRIEAAGNMMMLGLLTWGIYPALDYALQKVYGESDAKKLRRGPSARIYELQELFGGEKSIWNIIANDITMPAGTKLLGAIASGGRDPFTGQPITQPGMDPLTQGEQAADYALGQVFAPYQLFGRRPEEQGGRSVGRRIISQYVTGEKDTSEGAERGRFRAERFQQRQARRRAMRPRGPLERAGSYLGGD